MHESKEGPQMSSTEELIGRDSLDDLEAILSVANTDAGEQSHAVEDRSDAMFTWDYEKAARPRLNRLYEKAKGAMWNAETDLPWDVEVDQEAL
ncbi:MAG TPA: ferritin-like domain-containing protein, partial [Acidimicrobiales bacterium]|nr:ferritin-like domain-containing protein [Acidimicrobiales bacterium]